MARVYEVAKKHGISNEELLKLLADAGFTVKSHMSGVTEEMESAVAGALKATKKTPKKAASKKVEKEPKKAKAKAKPKAKAKATKKPSVKKSETVEAAKKERAAKKAVSKKTDAAVSEAPKSGDKPGAVTPGDKTATRKTVSPKAPQTKAPHKEAPGRKPPPSKRPRVYKKPSATDLEPQQKAVRESVRRTLAKLEVTRKTKRRKDKPQEEQPQEEQPIELSDQVAVKDLAKAFDVEVNDLLKHCMDLGVMANINQQLDREVIDLLAEALGKKVTYEAEYGEAVLMKQELEIDPSFLTTRAPVVTIMGHVDHGKTSILDFIRESNVVGGEVGGITQHVGAYEVNTPTGKITFIDTPGHEAFTSIRARGASVTDIVVLVVAADDGVMPQTREAIQHARAAEVPIMVAVNKMDLAAANPDRVKQQLTEEGVIVEDFGGDILCTELSAKTGDGISKLLEMIVLQAELLELKAYDKGPASGVVIEVKKEEGRGNLCTVLIKQGVLGVGDVFVTGVQYGKVRALLNHKGETVKEVMPASPVVVLGCNGLPNAGDIFSVVKDEREAREISVRRQEMQRQRDLRSPKKLTLEELYSQIQQGSLKELKLVIKGDTTGSVEALVDSVTNLTNDDVRVNVILAGVGFISESDVLLAASSNALIIGFTVKASPTAQQLAEKERVEMRNYAIIYECLSEIKDAMEGMLEPEMVERVVGQAEVRKVFKVSRLGTIAGSMVLDGTIIRNSQVRVRRDDEVVFDGKISSLKRFQDDVREVQKDFECGIGVSGFNDIEEGDILETYVIEQKSKLS